MTSAESPDPVAVEVGRRLRERRQLQGSTLETVSAAADISLSHLAEIETGKSSCSLPVLVRLSRALDYPMAEILPTLGASPVRVESLGSMADGERVISHERLDLVVREVRLSNGDGREVELGGGDSAVYVLDGTCAVEGSGLQASLAVGDSVSMTAFDRVRLSAEGEASATVLVVGENR